MSYRPHTRNLTIGFGGPPSRDVIVLLAVIFVTFSLQFFAVTGSLLQWLRLTPLVWSRGLLWQLVAYPFVGTGPPSPWILLELLILYWFASDVRSMLGRRRFWNLLIFASVGAAIVAAVVHLLLALSGLAAPGAFGLMQGQRMVMIVVIAAFATLRAEATILLFFVLRIKAKWFLWLEIALGFIGFLGTYDFAGFVGICTAVGLTVGLLRPRRLRGLGRETRLRLERWWIERKLGRMRQKSKLRLVGDDKQEPRKGPWVN